MLWLAIGCLVVLACVPTRGTIGAMLGQKPDGRLFVRAVPQGLGASKAGLRPGDEILLIDGRDVRPLSARQLHEALVGDVDTVVKLTVVRDGEVLRVTVTRTEAQRFQVGAPSSEGASSATDAADTAAPDTPPAPDAMPPDAATP